MEIVVHSKNSVSIEVSKEIGRFQQGFATNECDVKNDSIGLSKSDFFYPTANVLRNPTPCDSDSL